MKDKTFYRWMKVPPTTETMIEVTKDYFSEGDEYINRDNGWTPLNESITVKVEENDKKEN